MRERARESEWARDREREREREREGGGKESECFNFSKALEAITVESVLLESGSVGVGFHGGVSEMRGRESRKAPKQTQRLCLFPVDTDSLQLTTILLMLLWGITPAITRTNDYFNNALRHSASQPPPRPPGVSPQPRTRDLDGGTSVITHTLSHALSATASSTVWEVDVDVVSEL